MSDIKDWNTWNKNVIAEFRASEGRVGGNLEDMPIILVHHLGRQGGSSTSTRWRTYNGLYRG